MHAAKERDPHARETRWGLLVAFITLTLLFIPILSRA